MEEGFNKALPMYVVGDGSYGTEDGVVYRAVYRIAEDNTSNAYETTYSSVEGSVNNDQIFTGAGTLYITNKVVAKNTASIAAVKQLVGRDWIGGDDGDDFAFTLTPVGKAQHNDDGTVKVDGDKVVYEKDGESVITAIPMPKEDTDRKSTNTTDDDVVTASTTHATNETQVVDPKGKYERLARFGEIEYELSDLDYKNGLYVGDFYYEMAEVVPDADDTKGITYDDTEHTVHVHVEANRTRELSVQVAYDETTSGDASTGTQFTPVFTNRYAAQVDKAIEIEKRIMGRTWNEDEYFTFSIRPMGSAPFIGASYDKVAYPAAGADAGKDHYVNAGDRSKKLMKDDGVTWKTRDELFAEGYNVVTDDGAMQTRIDTMGKSGTADALEGEFNMMRWSMSDLNWTVGVEGAKDNRDTSGGAKVTLSDGTEAREGAKYGRFYYAVAEVDGAEGTNATDLFTDEGTEYAQVTVIDKGDGTLDIQVGIFEDRYGQVGRFTPNDDGGSGGDAATKVTFVNQAKRTLTAKKAWRGPATADVDVKLQYALSNNGAPADNSDGWKDASTASWWPEGVATEKTIRVGETSAEFLGLPMFANVEGANGGPDDLNLNDTWIYYRIQETTTGNFTTSYSTPNRTEARNDAEATAELTVTNDSTAVAGSATPRVTKELTGRDWLAVGDTTASGNTVVSADAMPADGQVKADKFTFHIEPYGIGSYDASGALNVDGNGYPAITQTKDTDVIPVVSGTGATATAVKNGQTGTQRTVDFGSISYPVSKLTQVDGEWKGDFFYVVSEDIPSSAIALGAELTAEQAAALDPSGVWRVGDKYYKKEPTIAYNIGVTWQYSLWLDTSTGITYSSDKYLARVNAEYKDGAVQTKVTYYPLKDNGGQGLEINGAASETAPVLSNSYDALGSYAFFTAKHIDGRSFSGTGGIDQFQFRLTPIGNAAMNPANAGLAEDGTWTTPVLNRNNPAASVNLANGTVPTYTLSAGDLGGGAAAGDHMALAGRGLFWLDEIESSSLGTSFVYELNEIDPDDSSTGTVSDASIAHVSDLDYSTDRLYLKITVSDNGNGTLKTEGHFYTSAACTDASLLKVNGVELTAGITASYTYDASSENKVAVAYFTNTRILNVPVSKTWRGSDGELIDPLQDVEIQLEAATLRESYKTQPASGAYTEVIGSDDVTYYVPESEWALSDGSVTFVREEFYQAYIDGNEDDPITPAQARADVDDPTKTDRDADWYNGLDWHVIGNVEKTIEGMPHMSDDGELVYRVREVPASGAYTMSSELAVGDLDTTSKKVSKTGEGATGYIGTYVNGGTLAVTNTVTAQNTATPSAVKQLIGRNWNATDRFDFTLEPLGKAAYTASGALDTGAGADDLAKVVLATTQQDDPDTGATETVVDTDIPMPAAADEVELNGAQVRPAQNGATATIKTADVAVGEHLATFGQITFNESDLSYNSVSGHLQGDFYYKMSEVVPDEADRKGIAYDEKAHLVHIHVEENSTDKLVATVIYDQTDPLDVGSGAKFTPVFTNYYSATGETAGKVRVLKAMLGDGFVAGQSFDFTMQALAGAPFADADAGQFFDTANDPQPTKVRDVADATDAEGDTAWAAHNVEGAHLIRMTVQPGEGGKKDGDYIYRDFPSIKFTADDLNRTVAAANATAADNDAVIGSDGTRVREGVKYGRFVYAIEEVPGNLDDIIYDTDTEYARVTAIDLEDGTIDIVVDYYSEPSCNAASKRPNATASPFSNQTKSSVWVEKKWIGVPDADVTVHLERAMVPDNASEYTGATAVGETFTDGGTTYTVVQMGDKKYTVAEDSWQAPEAWGSKFTAADFYHTFTTGEFTGTDTVKHEFGGVATRDGWTDAGRNLVHVSYVYRLVETDATDGSYTKTYPHQVATGLAADGKTWGSEDDPLEVDNTSNYTAKGSAELQSVKVLNGRDFVTEGDAADRFTLQVDAVSGTKGDGTTVAAGDMPLPTKTTTTGEGADAVTTIETVKTAEAQVISVANQGRADFAPIPFSQDHIARNETTGAFEGDYIYRITEIEPTATSDYPVTYTYEKGSDTKTSTTKKTDAQLADGSGDDFAGYTYVSCTWKGVTYPAAERFAKVHVESTGANGDLQTTVTYWLDAACMQANTQSMPYFTNTYNAKTYARGWVQKHVAGRNWKDYAAATGDAAASGDAFQFTITGIGGAIMNPTLRSLDNSVWSTPVMVTGSGFAESGEGGLNEGNAGYLDRQMRTSDGTVVTSNNGDVTDVIILTGEGALNTFDLDADGEQYSVYAVNEKGAAKIPGNDAYAVDDLLYDESSIYLRIHAWDNGDGTISYENEYFSEPGCSAESKLDTHKVWVKADESGRQTMVADNDAGLVASGAIGAKAAVDEARGTDGFKAAWDTYRKTGYQQMDVAYFENTETVDIPVEKVWVGAPTEDVTVHLQQALFKLDDEKYLDGSSTGAADTNEYGDAFVAKKEEGKDIWRRVGRAMALPRADFGYASTDSTTRTETDGSTTTLTFDAKSTADGVETAGVTYENTAFNMGLPMYVEGDGTTLDADGQRTEEGKKYRAVYRLVEDGTSSAYTPSYKSIQPNGDENDGDQVFIDSGTMVVTNTVSVTSDAYLAAVKQLVGREWLDEDAYRFTVAPIGKAQYFTEAEAEVYNSSKGLSDDAAKVEGDIKLDDDGKVLLVKSGDDIVTSIPMPEADTDRMAEYDGAKNESTAKATAGTSQVGQGEHIARFGKIHYTGDSLVFDAHDRHLQGDFFYKMSEVVPDDATITVEGVEVAYGNATDEQKKAGGFAKNGVTYDAKDVIVHVKVRENRTDTLTVQVFYNDYTEDLVATNFDGSGFTPVFTNSYQAAASQLSIPVAKRMYRAGDAKWAENDEFKFKIEAWSPGTPTLQGESGASITPTTTVGYGNKHADGETGDSPTADRWARFPDIPLTQAGEYVYRITEEPGRDTTLSYDADKLFVKAVVTDSLATGGYTYTLSYHSDYPCTDDNQLKAGDAHYVTVKDSAASAEEPAPLFVNSEVRDLYVQKTWLGSAPADVTVKLQWTTAENPAEGDWADASISGVETQHTFAAADFDTFETAQLLFGETALGNRASETWHVGGAAVVPTVDAQGKAYKYRVVETSVGASYELAASVSKLATSGDAGKTATGASDDPLLVVNRSKATTTVSGAKEWLDPLSADGDTSWNERADNDKLKLTLHRSSSNVTTVQSFAFVNEEGQAVDEKAIDGFTAKLTWTGDKYEISNVRAYDDKGAPYTYWVTEEKVDGYQAATYKAADGSKVADLSKPGAPDGGTISNLVEQELVTVSIRKHWDDQNNRDGRRPSQVELHLYRDGEDMQDTYVTAEGHRMDVDNWTYTFKPNDADGYDKYDDKGHVYSYAVREDPSVRRYHDATYYDVQATDKVDGVYALPDASRKLGPTAIGAPDGGTIVNTYEPETFDLTGVKTWKYAGAPEDNKPTDATLYLQRRAANETHDDADADWEFVRESDKTGTQDRLEAWRVTTNAALAADGQSATSPAFTFAGLPEFKEKSAASTSTDEVELEYRVVELDKHDHYVPTGGTADVHYNVTNTYAPDPVKLDQYRYINVQKVIDVVGDEGAKTELSDADWSAKDYAFAFQLTATEGKDASGNALDKADIPMPEGSTSLGDGTLAKQVVVTADSTATIYEKPTEGASSASQVGKHAATFGRIDFSKPGVYEYDLREIPPRDVMAGIEGADKVKRFAGMTYNTGEYFKVVITVTEGKDDQGNLNGELVIDEVLLRHTEQADEKIENLTAEVRNTYDPKHVAYNMEAAKHYVDYANDSVAVAPSGAFSFTMRPVGTDEQKAKTPMPENAYDPATGVGLQGSGANRVYYAKNYDGLVRFEEGSNGLQFDDSNVGTYSYELAEVVPGNARYIGGGYWRDESSGIVYDGAVHERTLTAAFDGDGVLGVSAASGDSAYYLNPDVGTYYRDLPADAAKVTSVDAADEFKGRHNDNGVPTFLNRHDPLTSFSATKVWDDADDIDGKRPYSVTMTLMRYTHTGAPEVVTQDGLGNAVETREVLGTAEAGDLVVSWDNLPAYDATGDAYTYIVAETAYKQDADSAATAIVDRAYGGDEGYDVTYLNSHGEQPDVHPHSGAPDGGSIVNSHEPATGEIAAHKTWIDEGNQDNLRADVTLHLYRQLRNADGSLKTTDGKPALVQVGGVEAQVIPAGATGDAARVRWGGLPIVERVNVTDASGTTAEQLVPVRYWVLEDSLAGYTAAYEYPADDRDATDAGVELEEGVLKEVAITNSHTPEVTEVTVAKAWDDGDDVDGARPRSVTVRLLADGEDTGKTLTLTAADGWRGTFSGLDANSQGRAIVYTVAEDAVDGYDAEPVITGCAYEGFTVTNRRDRDTASLSVTMTWDDANDKGSLRPEFVEFEVQQKAGDGSWTHERTFVVGKRDAAGDDANAWNAIISGLPVNVIGEDGVPKAMSYRVVELSHEPLREAGYNLTGPGYSYVSPDVTPADGRGATAGQTMQFDVANKRLTAEAKVPVTVYKQIEGRTFAAGDEFTFTLEAATEGAPMPESQWVTVKPDSDESRVSASFGEITFTAADLAGADTKTFLYVVREADGGITESGLSYDSVAKVLTVVVSRDGDDVKASHSWAYAGDTFTNTYGVSPVTAPFTVAKVVSGGSKSAADYVGRFSFRAEAKEATLADGTPMEVADIPMPQETTATNDDDNGSTADFGTVTFRKAGTYVYTVTEDTSAAIDGITYDAASSHELTYRVAEQLDENGRPTGKLAVESTTGATFTNIFDPESAKVRITAKKVWEDDDPSKRSEVVFTLIATTEDGWVKTDSKTVATGADHADDLEATWMVDAKREGKVVEFEVVEQTPDGYEAAKELEVDEPASKVYVFTNKPVDPETETVRAVKTWVDGGDQDGKRPTITLQLQKRVGADGEWADATDADMTGVTMTVKADDKETKLDSATPAHEVKPRDGDTVSVTWDGLKTEQDSGLSGASVDEVTEEAADETDEADEADVAGDGDESGDGSASTAEEADEDADVGVAQTAGAPASGGASEGGTSAQKMQPVYYRVVEKYDGHVVDADHPIDGYAALSAREGSGEFRLMNVHTPSTVDITASKVWNDGNDALGERPAYVEFQLVRDGVAYGDPKTVYGSGTVTWEDVPEYSGKVDEDGQALKSVYLVREVNSTDSNYVQSGEGTEANGYVIVNTYEKPVTVTLKKEWYDKDGKAIEPGTDVHTPSVVFGLYKVYDKTEVPVATFTVPDMADVDPDKAEEQMSVTWDKLNAYEGDFECKYEVRELTSSSAFKSESTMDDSQEGVQAHTFKNTLTVDSYEPAPVDDDSPVHVFYVDAFRTGEEGGANAQIVASATTTVAEADAKVKELRPDDPSYPGLEFTGWTENRAEGDIIMVATYKVPTGMQVVSYVDSIAREVIQSDTTDDLDRYAPGSGNDPAAPAHDNCTFVEWVKQTDAAGNVIYISKYESTGQGTPGAEPSNSGGGTSQGTGESVTGGGNDDGKAPRTRPASIAGIDLPTTGDKTLDTVILMAAIAMLAATIAALARARMILAAANGRRSRDGDDDDRGVPGGFFESLRSHGEQEFTIPRGEDRTNDK